MLFLECWHRFCGTSGAWHGCGTQGNDRLNLQQAVKLKFLNVSSGVKPGFPAPGRGCGVYLVLGFSPVFKKPFVAEDESSLVSIKQNAEGMEVLDFDSSEQRLLHLGFWGNSASW